MHAIGMHIVDVVFVAANQRLWRNVTVQCICGFPHRFLFISFHLLLLCCVDFYACVHLFRRDIESKFMFYAWNRSLSHFRFFIHFVQFLLLLKYATGGGCCCCSWFCLLVCSCCAQWSMYRSNFYIWVLLWQKHHYYHLWGPYSSRSITTRKRHMNHIRFEPQNRRASARVECALGQPVRPFSLKFQLMDDLWDLEMQMLFLFAPEILRIEKIFHSIRKFFELTHT